MLEEVSGHAAVGEYQGIGSWSRLRVGNRITDNAHGIT